MAGAKDVDGKCSNEGGNNEDGREWGLPWLLYVDDLVLCGESEEDLMASFVAV